MNDNKEIEGLEGHNYLGKRSGDISVPSMIVWVCLAGLALYVSLNFEVIEWVKGLL